MISDRIRYSNLHKSPEIKGENTSVRNEKNESHKNLNKDLKIAKKEIIADI